MWQSFFSHMVVLDPKGPVAAGELHVMIITLLLCATIVVPVFFLLFYFAWKYRASNQKTAKHHAPNWDHDNTLAEFSWWLAPMIIIFLLAIVMWQSSHALDPYVPLASVNGPLDVEVVALDWKWLFIYPQYGVASVNLLEFPENTPVHFELTADAPMNSFWIPQLGGQIMVMPGMTTQLNLMADSAGDFNGYSANISGEGFAGMAFVARAVSQTDFQTWVNQVKQGSLPLNSASYAMLAEPSKNSPVLFYSTVDSAVYMDAIMKFMTPQSDMQNMSDMPDMKM